MKNKSVYEKLHSGENVLDFEFFLDREERIKELRDTNSLAYKLNEKYKSMKLSKFLFHIGKLS